MNRILPIHIRAMIIFGFALTAAAGVIAYFDELSMHAIQFDSFQDAVNPLLSPLMSIAALCAWTWLSNIAPLNGAQRRLLRGAYLFFAIQYVLLAVGFDFIFTPLHEFGNTWITATLWIEFLGALVVAYGLLLMVRSLATSGDVESTIPDVSEIS